MVGLIFVSDSNEFVRALQKYVNQVSKISAACGQLRSKKEDL